jgi:RecA-family ATPase
MVELLRLPPPEWLVKGILPAGGLVGLYGEPGSFKSFVAIDVAMSTATGEAWHGQAVKQGHVIYVAAEGGVGIAKRGHAWLLAHGVPPEKADIAWLTESIPVSVDSENMQMLFDRIEDDLRKTPSLVVIDTLARCFYGDENQQEDMGRFIGGVDRLRREFDATVIVVHHTRLGADRERGSTAFRGAADTMVECKRLNDSELELHCNKQKDSIEFDTRHLALSPVPEVDSVSLVDKAESTTERDGLIRQWIQQTPEGVSWRVLKAQALGSGISAASLKRRLVSLIKNDEIIRENGVYLYNRAHLK